MPYRRHKCPTCAREFAHLAMHQCPEHPAIVDWLARNLPDPDPARPGYIIRLAEFEAIEAKPLCAPALKRHFGSWAALADRFGLKCPPAHGGESRPNPEKIGYLHPEEIAELRRLAEALHAGEFGPSSSEFEMYAEGLPIGRHGMVNRFPTRSWHEVLRAAGLRAGTQAEYLRTGRIRTEQAQEAEQRQQRAAQPEQNQRKAPPARFTYERNDEPIPRDYLGIQAADYNRIDGRRRRSAGLTWTLI